MTGTAGTPALGPLRLLRAGAVLGAALLPALAAHSLAGAAVGAPATAVAASLLWPAAMILTRRRVGARALVPALAAGQGLAHVALTWAHTGSGSAVSSPHLHAAAHIHAPLRRPAADAGTEVVASLGTLSGSTPSLAMLGLHLLALILSILLITRAEAVLWAVVRAVLPALPGRCHISLVPQRCPHAPTLSPVQRHSVLRPRLRAPPRRLVLL